MGISGRRSVVVVLATFLVAFMISVKAEESTVIPVKAEEIEDVDYIVPLDFSNFTEYVYKQDFIVVEFYAPWCGACKGFYPEYKKAASVLVSHDPPTLRSSLQSYLAAEVIDLVDELFVKMFDKTHKNCQKELEAINRQYMFKPLEGRNNSLFANFV